MKILCVGNLNKDISVFIKKFPKKHEKIEAETLTINNGGSAANTACWLARTGIKTYFMGCVGEDGEEQIRSLKKFGVKTNLVKKTKNNTGTAIILQTLNDKRMIKFMGANKEIEVKEELIKKFDWVHASSLDETLRKKLFNICDKNNITLSYDPGSNIPGKELRKVDYLLLNEDELKRITRTPNIRASARKCGARNVLIGLNNGGALFINKNFEISVPKIRINEFIDGVGSGDAGNAGFIFEIISGGRVEDAVKLKVILSNYKIGFKGARTGIKNIKFFHKYLKK